MVRQRIYLAITLCLFLIKNILSFAPKEPSLRTCIEFPIAVLVILLTFSAFRTSRLATTLFAIISILVGSYYIFATTYVGFTGELYLYAACMYGVLHVVLGMLIAINRFNDRPTVSIKYIFSLIPIGYLALLAIHKPYPIEANLTLFAAQLIALFLLVLPSNLPGRRYRIVYNSVLSFIAFAFVMYAAFAMAAGGYMRAAEYAIYGIVVAWLGLKVSPYAHLVTTSRA